MRLSAQCLTMFLLVSSMNTLKAQNNFITVPATAYEVVDGITGIGVDVQIDEFIISKTELTQKEFFEITGYNPAYHQGPEYPVENVSWWECIRYCNLRSIKEGLETCYDLATGECDFSRNGYRLPTKAEWSLADSNDTNYSLETIHDYGNIGSANDENIAQLKKELNEKGTKKAGSYPPNKLGLYDMLGNVWEWCFDKSGSGKEVPIPLVNPQGPSWGPERVIRGGSFLSLASSWGREYSSSMKPEYKSRFTGFRVCRTTGRHEIGKRIDDQKWFEPYNNVPEGFENNTGDLSSLVKDAKGQAIKSVSGWQEKRKLIRAKWSKLLGTMPLAPPEPNVKLIRTFKEEIYTGHMMYLQVEPDFWEKIYLMIPDKPLAEPTPVVIVPYYDVDTPAGKNMSGRTYTPMGVRAFAYLMVQQGYIAVAVRWFGESYGENYGEAVANLKLKYPELTGLGKWVWDAQRLVDYLYTLPEVDQNNIGIIGHSLGGKMSLYAAAMDERITAVVCSELGLGLTFSNYEDYWYFDDSIRRIDKATDHHELLGLIAPRPFLLIGGDDADSDKSWYYINSAREVYTLFGNPRNIGYFNHRTGHTPTPEAVRLSVEWLKHFLTRE
ncbi:MAG TPA: SUMF1/EgtB/PvdO family nonheme iron enzyme [archaeon]|nr:SUMF1/EgtB/PvdO family nonheme iron enzyme [archaeon]